MWNVTLAGCNGGMLHRGWIEEHKELHCIPRDGI